MRAEQEIFDELAGLCVSPGYAHAIAYLCSRDNMIRYSGEMKAEDMQQLFSKSRLIRTETSTLIGLMLKNPIDYTLPAPPVLEKYIEATEALLEEIHHTMTASFWQDIDPAKIAEPGFNPFTNGAALRATSDGQLPGALRLGFERAERMLGATPYPEDQPELTED